MRRAGRFGVNVLGRQHQPFATNAAPAGSDRFADVGLGARTNGVPLLTDSLASLECEVVAEHPAGDHWIVVGRVDELHIAPDTEPLIFFAGTFIAVQEQRPRCGSASSERRRVGSVRGARSVLKQRLAKS